MWGELWIRAACTLSPARGSRDCITVCILAVSRVLLKYNAGKRSIADFRLLNYHIVNDSRPARRTENIRYCRIEYDPACFL
ncbi:hypothetical protein D3C71_1936090 [compost metagenome]